jgi:hypothetical protein
MQKHQLESPSSKVLTIFILWVSGTFILFLIGAIGGIFSGWLIAFSIVANIIWIVVAILVGGIITQDL